MSNIELSNIELQETEHDSRVVINTISSNIINAISSGEMSGLQFKMKQKMWESIFEACKIAVDKAARDEAETYGEKTFKKFGGEVSLIEAGTKYDYSQCNDEEYLDLLVELEAVKLKVKDRETFLKSIKGSMNIVTKHGEAVTVFPPIKTSTSTLKITF